MLERLADPRYQTFATPCAEAVEFVGAALSGNPEPLIAAIGIGMGATTLALCRTLDHHGEIWLFDVEDRLEELGADLRAAGFENFKLCGASRRTHDSYSWTLALLLRRQRALQRDGIFDFIYLDGTHLHQHDTLAAVCAKDLLKVGGTLLMEAYGWTIARSPGLRQALHSSIRRQYSETQIELSHVEMICSLLLDGDARFARIPAQHAGREQRRAYRKIA